MAVTAQTVSQRIPRFRADLQTFLQQANGLDWSPDSTPQAVTQTLRQVYSQGGQFQQLIAVTAGGQVLATYPAGSVPTLTSEEQSANHDALAAGAAMITNGQAGSEHLLSVVVPMVSSAGQPMGTLIGRIPGLVVDDLVDGVNSIPGRGQVMLVDEHSQIITRSDQSSRLVSWTPPTTQFKTYPGRADVGGTVYEGVATGQGREMEYALAGGQSHPWTTVVTMPYAALITLALQISIPWLGIFLLLMVAFGANLWVIGQSITRPLNELVTASQHVAQGSLNTPIQIESQDEIGSLVRLSKACVTPSRAS
jgi:HAMP domain-containing protein